MIDEPPFNHYPFFAQWRLRAEPGTGLQYELAYQTLDDGSHQVVFDADTFTGLLNQAMGLHTMTDDQKAELIKAAEEGEQHDLN